MNHVEMDALRARWAETVESVLPQAEFVPYLASHLNPLLVLFVAQPGDPRATTIDFDDVFLDWLSGEHAQGPLGTSWRWGDLRLTSNHAVLAQDRDNFQWARYLAIDQSGALQVGLGRDVGGESHGNRHLSLTGTVARVWTALDAFQELIGIAGLGGPFELSLHVPDAKDLVLAGFGDGWAEPESGLYDHVGCREPEIHLRKEVREWPGQDAARTLAFALGRQLNRAWGIRGDRFLNRVGERAGEFALRLATD